MDIRAVSKLSSRALGPPRIELDRIDFPEPVFVHIDHVAVIRSRLHQYTQVILARISFDRSLFRQMRRFYSRRTSHLPPEVFAGRGNVLIPMKERAISERLSQIGKHFPPWITR